MKRELPVLLSVLFLVACAPGETTRTAKNETLVPVYSCVGTRIANSKRCRATRSVNRPTEVIQAPKQPTAIESSRSRKPSI